jgi:hypothetical protein
MPTLKSLPSETRAYIGSYLPDPTGQTQKVERVKVKKGLSSVTFFRPGKPATAEEKEEVNKTAAKEANAVYNRNNERGEYHKWLWDDTTSRDILNYRDIPVLPPDPLAVPVFSGGGGAGDMETLFRFWAGAGV